MDKIFNTMRSRLFVINYQQSTRTKRTWRLSSKCVSSIAQNYPSEKLHTTSHPDPSLPTICCNRGFKLPWMFTTLKVRVIAKLNVTRNVVDMPPANWLICFMVGALEFDSRLGNVRTGYWLRWMDELLRNLSHFSDDTLMLCGRVANYINGS